MSNPAPQFFCANHFGLPTHRVCADCGRPFCESCLTEMSAQMLCGWCRDQRLQRIQQRTSVNPATTVLLARVFNGIALLLVLCLAALYAGISVFAGMSSPAGTPSSADATGMGILLTGSVVGAVLAFLTYLPPLLGLGPGRAWLWTWQLVALVLSILGGCVLFGSIGMLLLVPAVLLLIYWLKPEVKDYCAWAG